MVDSPLGPLVFHTTVKPATMHAFDPSAPANARISTFSAIGRTLKQIEQPQLDWRLRSNVVPFRDITDLSNEYGFGSLPTQDALVEVRAHLVAAMDGSSTVRDGQARLGVRIPRLAFKKLVSVGLLIQTNAPSMERRRIDGENIEFRPADDNPEILVGWFTEEVPVGAVVHSYASYAGLSMNSWSVWDPTSVPNPLRRAVEVFDSELSRLQKGFEPVLMAKRGSGKSDELEHAVAAILWMTGFAAYRLGAGNNNNAIDLMARSPSGHIVVIECSHGLLPSDKRQKLVKRANEVRDALVGTWFSGHIKVIALMVTSDKRESIKNSADDARKEGIAVLTHDDLEDILGRTIVLPDADELFRQLEASLLPTTEQAR